MVHCVQLHLATVVQHCLKYASITVYKTVAYMI